jgi:uncharacterized protein with NAD-binding domain and iron-sulfur cluster
MFFFPPRRRRSLIIAYFFVLQSQTAFDVQWVKGGNIGTVIFEPWVKSLQKQGVEFRCNTRVTGFTVNDENKITTVHCQSSSPSQSTSTAGDVTNTTSSSTELQLPADEVVFAVGAKALNNFATYCPELSQYAEFRRFGNLRGTSVLATRLFLDRHVTVPYSANACWGFDDGVGMTLFDITTLHGPNATTTQNAPGSVIEVDYYHANTILLMSDNDIVTKVKKDLDTMLGYSCQQATVVDAAIVRLPQAVNWYFPGSYADMPDVKSASLSNVYFAGDIVRTRHGSWSQEKAYVTGLEAANLILGRPIDHGVLPVAADEVHVKFGKDLFALVRSVLSGGDSAKGRKSGFSLVDFLF